MSRRKIAIIGANGRLGRALQEVCSRENRVTALTRHDLDLAWRGARIREALDPLEIEVLLLAAGNTNVDYCEIHPEVAEQENAIAVNHIAEWCAAKNVRLINFSSDYVFDGKKTGPYVEDDAVNPLSAYGESKLAGEEATLAASDRNLVVRLEWLFGPGKPSATPDWAVQMAVEGGAVKIVSDRISTPTSTHDIAEALVPILFDDANATGLLHLSNSGSCTWQEWGQFCIDCAADCDVPLKTREVGALRMDEIFGDRANRPRYTVFSTGKFEALTGRTLPPWQDAVKEYINGHVAPRFL